MTRIVTSFAIPFSIVYRWIDRPTWCAAVSETLFRWCSPSNEEWVCLLWIRYFQMEAALERVVPAIPTADVCQITNQNHRAISWHEIAPSYFPIFVCRSFPLTLAADLSLTEKKTCLLTLQAETHHRTCLIYLTTQTSIKWKFPIQSRIFFFFVFLGGKFDLSLDKVRTLNPRVPGWKFFPLCIAREEQSLSLYSHIEREVNKIEISSTIPGSTVLCVTATHTWT